MSVAEERYVPAAGRRAFTRLYDPVLALTMRERTFRGRLLDQVLADLPASGGRVVDVGCGTGTFAIALAAALPGAEVTAIDGDAGVLALAQAKPGAARVSLSEGLAEAARVLRPGGRLHIADWGRPHDPLMRAAFFVLQLADGFEGTRDHASGLLPQLVAEAGFGDVTRRDRLRTAWGSLELLAATKPANDAQPGARA